MSKALEVKKIEIWGKRCKHGVPWWIPCPDCIILGARSHKEGKG